MTLTAKRLRELLHYDPTTGTFVWLVDRSRGVKAGDPAGCTNYEGYRQVTIDRKTYKQHRLAFLYMTGQWPSEQVDHRDNNRANNRWNNLRLATHKENMRNSRKSRSNSTGFKGVYKFRGKYGARIYGPDEFLGYFETPLQAFWAVRRARHKLHGEFARNY